jgi:paraquat-inducible protein A
MLPAVPPRGVAACLRCDHVLMRHRRDPLRGALALALAGLFCFLIAVAMPLVSIDIGGRGRLATLFTEPEGLEQAGMWPLSIVVALTIFLLPAAKLAMTLTVLIAARLRRRPIWLPRLFAWSRHIGPWAMIEVFLLGMFVAYTRLLAIARVELGPALYALGAFMVVMALCDAQTDRETLWQTLDLRRGDAPPPQAPEAAGVRLIGCDCCRLVSRAAEGTPCRRCGTPLRHRRPNSISSAWALLAAATVLYLPANFYPVMTVIRLGRGQPNTILSGAAELLQIGMWPLALLVFFASITVPVLKLVGLVLMLVTTQRGYCGHLRDRTRLYRIVEQVGRWSMIDVFMISILVALVQVGAIASIQPGSGAIAFAAVVVLTMFAAEMFDPRLMWDAAAAKPKVTK